MSIVRDQTWGLSVNLQSLDQSLGSDGPVCTLFPSTLFFSLSYCKNFMMGCISSWGFGCDHWSLACDLYRVCVFGLERLVQKHAFSLSPSHFSSSAWCLRSVLSFLSVWLRGGKEKVTRRWQMFRGLCGDSRECGELRTPAVKRGARELHRAPSGHCGVGSDLRLIAAGARGQKVDVIHRNRTNRYYTYPAA